MKENTNPIHKYSAAKKKKKNSLTWYTYQVNNINYLMQLSRLSSTAWIYMNEAFRSSENLHRERASTKTWEMDGDLMSLRRKKPQIPTEPHLIHSTFIPFTPSSPHCITL